MHHPVLQNAFCEPLRSLLYAFLLCFNGFDDLSGVLQVIPYYIHDKDLL
jgi:hypothetical protein